MGQGCHLQIRLHPVRYLENPALARLCEMLPANLIEYISLLSCEQLTVRLGLEVRGFLSRNGAFIGLPSLLTTVILVEGIA